MDEQIKSFQRDGFIILRNVLTLEQVSSLRTTLIQLLHRPMDERGLGDEENTLENIWVRFPQLRWVLFHKPVLNVLRQFLGEKFVFLRDGAAHLNNSVPWHRDTDTYEKAEYDFHRQKNFQVVNICYYLQDSEKGGLEIIPRSHLLNFKPFSQVGRWKRSQEKPITIPSRAGDAILFDPRLIHRGTQANKGTPEEKVAIFFSSTNTSAPVKTIHDLFLLDPDICNLYLRDFHYPEELLKMAEQHGTILP